VNNENSVNLRVMTHEAITEQNVPAKQAQIDGITLLPGEIQCGVADSTIGAVVSRMQRHNEALEMNHQVHLADG
jgi:hypothetical protein